MRVMWKMIVPTMASTSPSIRPMVSLNASPSREPSAPSHHFPDWTRRAQRIAFMNGIVADQRRRAKAEASANMSTAKPAVTPSERAQGIPVPVSARRTASTP
jgi:hypothetical protein